MAVLPPLYFSPRVAGDPSFARSTSLSYSEDGPGKRSDLQMHTDPKKWAQIRFIILSKGQSIRSVALSEGMSRNTIRKIIRQEEPTKYARVARATLITGYEAFVDTMMSDDALRPPRERRSIASIARTLKDMHGYSGGYSAVHRYCRRKQTRHIDLTLRLSGGLFTSDSLTIVQKSEAYRLRTEAAGSYSSIGLHLSRDIRSERSREVAAWIDRLRGDQLEHSVSGDLTVVSRLMECVHVPQKRQRNRAIAALAYQQGFPNNQIAKCLGISRRTSRRYIRIYRNAGVEALLAPETRGIRKADREDLRGAVFRLLHSPPKDHGINRTSWIMSDLRMTLLKQGFPAGTQVVRQIIHDAGWKWRKARVALTSQDPAYREKLSAVQDVLGQLGSDEAFFSIDEFGPFAVKMKPGKMLDPPGPHRVVPQWQKSKGCLIMTAALELQTNQITHFYSLRKNTTEMIRMLDVLLAQYADRRTIYLSWDAASWHVSKKLRARIEEHNASATVTGRPRVETVPLPAGAQFLNVIESIFSGMARAIIHNSDYASVDAVKEAIRQYFDDRNAHFQAHPKRAGKHIWGKERVPATFVDSNNCKEPNWR